MRILRLAFSFAFLLSGCAAHAADTTPKDDINNYLVDITGGAVSASNLVGVDKSGITQIQTSQDIVAALQPLVSGDQKAGFGLAITPARTPLLPMAGSTYVGNRLAPLLGNLTFSYAQSGEDIKSTTYKKSAFSVDTVYYLNIDEDPIMIASKAFKTCAQPDIDQNARDIAAVLNANPPLSDTGKNAALAALTAKLATTTSTCIDAKLKEEARWNSSRFSVSYGQGRIKAPGAESHSLAKAFTVNGQFRLGDQGQAAVSLRRVTDAIDKSSLAASTPTYKTSSLAAGRLTYGDLAGSDFRVLAEISNSKSSSAAALSQAFKYALGLDKKIFKGTWLEFRVGRNHSLDDGKEQTMAMLNVNLSPTLFDFKK